MTLSKLILALSPKAASISNRARLSTTHVPIESAQLTAGSPTDKDTGPTTAPDITTVIVVGGGGDAGGTKIVKHVIIARYELGM